VPSEVNLVIEIPRARDVKYEMDEETAFVFVDRHI
jgi:inorganic pyrophosphatase